MCGSPVSMKENKAREDKYRAEDDSRTLMRADEIRRDKSRVSRAQAHVREQMSAMGRVAGAGEKKSKSRGRKRSRSRR